jgi:two-component system response regulator RpaA
MQRDSKPKTILVVDDDPQVVEMIHCALRLAGFSVATAPDGVTALKMARALLPDLILLDLVLPELDGFSVCETLRRDRTTASIPIIMLTGLSSQLNRFAGLESGANDYLPKPLDLSLLIARIRTLISEAANKQSEPA